jgi:hypothetical protein
MTIERVVQVVEAGRRFTFRVEHDPPFGEFWCVEVAGRAPIPVPLRVTGTEQPAFFRALAQMIAEREG